MRVVVLSMITKRNRVFKFISNFVSFSVLIQSRANIGPPAKRHLNGVSFSHVGMFPGYKDNKVLLKATAHVQCPR